MEVNRFNSTYPPSRLAFASTASRASGAESVPAEKSEVRPGHVSLYDKGGYKLSASLRFGMDPDLKRFEDIVKKKVREDLKKFISPDNFETVSGGKKIRIPKPNIKIPTFRRGGAPQGGVGSGQGNPGDTIGQVGKDGQPQPGKPGEPGDEPGEAGEETGDHDRENSGITISRSEIAQMIMEDLRLPNLQPKGSANIIEESIKFTDISQVGAMVDKRATLLEAIRRTTSEVVDATADDVVIQPEDIRYITWETDQLPQHNAVIIYMMDVSGSMGEEQKKMARTASWYLSTIIGQQFGEMNAELKGQVAGEDSFGDGVEEVFITHDTEANEVSEEEFYSTTAGGGTKISSAWAKAEEIIKQRYNPDEWNIYIYHYSDGDNWGNDNQDSKEIIDRLLPVVNSIGYIQTTSAFGSGEFQNFLAETYGRNDRKLRIAHIENDDADDYKDAVYEMLSEREDSN